MIKSIEIKEKWKPHLVITIFAFMLYGNTLNHSFALDDIIVLSQNKFTQQGIEGIPKIFKYDSFLGFWLSDYEGQTEDQLKQNVKMLSGGRYRPLSLVTFALEVEFFGKENKFPNSTIRFVGNSFVSHLINILLYVVTMGLLYLVLCNLLCRSTERDLTSEYQYKVKKWYESFPFVVTLLFLFHPIHTEVVANIKGRDEIMALLGSISALWFTIKYIDSHKNKHLVFSGVCFLGGLLSKENAITFLAVIPVSILYFKDRKINKILISMIPLFVATAVFLVIRTNVLGFITSTQNFPDLLTNPFINATGNETIATVCYTLLLYLKLLFFPHPLTYDYYPHHIEIMNWSNPLALLSLLIYIGFGIYALFGLFKKRDIISYAIWIYLLPLSAVANLLFQTGTFMGERFVFFSSLGFVVFLGWLIYGFIPSFSKNSQLSMALTSSALIIILCLYAGKTITRNFVWKDNFTLFTTDVKTSKNSAKANYMAGSLLYYKTIYPENDIEFYNKNNVCQEATKRLQCAVQLYPQYVNAFTLLADLSLNCFQDIAKSLYYCTMVLQNSAPVNDFIINYIDLVLSMADVLLEENQVTSTPEEIVQACDDLLKIHPEIGKAYYVRGIVYVKYFNHTDSALFNFEQALAMDFPKTAKFYEYVGATYALAGNNVNALLYLLKAVELGSNDYTTYLNIGTIYQRIGDKDNAKKYTAKGESILNNKG